MQSRVVEMRGRYKNDRQAIDYKGERGLTMGECQEVAGQAMMRTRKNTRDGASGDCEVEGLQSTSDARIDKVGRRAEGDRYAMNDRQLVRQVIPQGSNRSEMRRFSRNTGT